MVSLKIDAEEPAGAELKDQYGISGYPTLLFTDADGNEIDRIIGYRPPDIFLDELNRIQQGINTLPALIKSAKEQPDNFTIQNQLAVKYDSMGEIILARDVYQSIVDLGVDSAGTAAFQLLVFRSLEGNNPFPLISYADENPDNENMITALQHAMSLVRISDENPLLEADLYVRLIGMFETPDPGMLNGFAWRMSELELNLDLALDRIDYAISNETDEDNKHMYIDTKAEILWKLGRSDEAVSEIEKCIQFDPENIYYQEQKKKFTGEVS